MLVCRANGSVSQAAAIASQIHDAEQQQQARRSSRPGKKPRLRALLAQLAVRAHGARPPTATCHVTQLLPPHGLPAGFAAAWSERRGAIFHVNAIGRLCGGSRARCRQRRCEFAPQAAAPTIHQPDLRPAHLPDAASAHLARLPPPSGCSPYAGFASLQLPGPKLPERALECDAYLVGAARLVALLGAQRVHPRQLFRPAAQLVQPQQQRSAAQLSFFVVVVADAVAGDVQLPQLHADAAEYRGEQAQASLPLGIHIPGGSGRCCDALLSERDESAEDLRRHFVDVLAEIVNVLLIGKLHARRAGVLSVVV